VKQKWTKIQGKRKGTSRTRRSGMRPLELSPVIRQTACRSLSNKLGSRLPLLSTRLVVTFLAEHHCLLSNSKLYCLMTDTRRCEQLSLGCCADLQLNSERVSQKSVQCSTCCIATSL